MLGFRRLTSSSTTGVSRTVFSGGKSRCLGGTGKPGPYDLPHQGYPTEAYFGGKKNYQWEGWEGITAFTYITCGLALCFMTKPFNSFRDWANREALAREKRVENGEEVEFGIYYQTIKYVDNKEMSGLTTIEDEE